MRSETASWRVPPGATGDGLIVPADGRNCKRKGRAPPRSEIAAPDLTSRGRDLNLSDARARLGPSHPAPVWGSPVIAVSCACGKLLQGSDDLAGETVQCPKCRVLVAFPRPLPPAHAAPTPAAAEAPAPAAPAPGFWSSDCLYWVLLLALLPLALAVFQDRATLDVRKRLEATLKAHPELKPRLVELMQSEAATVEDLFRLLPGHRIDRIAWLPRESDRHWLFAAVAVAAFFAVG